MATKKRRRTTVKKATRELAKSFHLSAFSVHDMVNRLNKELRSAGLKFVKAKRRPGWYRLVARRLARSR
jgi:transposase